MCMNGKELRNLSLYIKPWVILTIQIQKEQPRFHELDFYGKVVTLLPMVSHRAEKGGPPKEPSLIH
jgi:hypothetical protein